MRMLLLFALLQAAGAATVSYVGSLNPNDPNDLFQVQIDLLMLSPIRVQSFGYGGGTNAAGTLIPGGGFDTYVSIFDGWGPGATFLASNDDGCLGCPDSAITTSPLPVGHYTVVLSVFDNYSFAENLGTGTLGDGFIGLGSYFSGGGFRISDYAIDIEFASPTAVPEPGAGAVVLLGIIAIIARKRKEHRIIGRGITSTWRLVLSRHSDRSVQRGSSYRAACRGSAGEGSLPAEY
jgi:hypothetical protein